MPMPIAASITPQRILLYTTFSSFAALGVVFRAFRERSNFYAATVFLGRSNGCLLVLLNFILCLALVFGRVLQQLLFGPLRAIELEHLYERSWYSLVGTLLAISTFRDDFDISFVLLFGTLLFLKVFHWLAGDRVEFMDQSPSIPKVFHVRMITILSSLLFIDTFLVAFAVEVLFFKTSSKTRGIGIMILFASEFMILTASLGCTIAKYGINCWDLYTTGHHNADGGAIGIHEEPGVWENKSIYIFYVDLTHDVIRLVIHAGIFILLTRWYGIPLSLIHDLYVTGRSCMTKTRDLVRYRKATANMDSKYPNATVAELESTDGTCIICREDMKAATTTTPTNNSSSHEASSNSNAHNGDSSTSNSTSAHAAPRPSATTTANSSNASTGNTGGLNMTPKKLPCGHIFHFHCLRSWLERQQSCPTCRRTVLDEAPATVDPLVNAQQPQQGGLAAPAQPGQAVPPPQAAAPTPAPHQATSSASSTTSAPTAAEQTFDQRLQSFIQRLQSDLQRVRQEGDLSARGHSLRTRSSSRNRRAGSGNANGHGSGNSTPTPNLAGPSAATANVGSARAGHHNSYANNHNIPVDGLAGTSGGSASPFMPTPYGATSTSTNVPLASSFLPSPSGFSIDAGAGVGLGQLYPGVGAGASSSVGSVAGGLWMPPPPSSLYLRGRRPESRYRSAWKQDVNDAKGNENVTHSKPDSDEAEPKGKGKGKEKAEEDHETEEKAAESLDPEDPREAIRLATLRRFGGLASTPITAAAAAQDNTGSSTGLTSSGSVGLDSASDPKPSSSSTSTTGQEPLTGLIPLFDPSRIPSFQQIHEPNLPLPMLQPLSTTTSDVGEGTQAAADVLKSKRSHMENQILHLTQIQAKIDQVIDLLGSCLDTFVVPDGDNNGNASSSGSGNNGGEEQQHHPASVDRTSTATEALTQPSVP